MSQLQEHVEQSIVSRRLLRRGQPVLIAVSGGLDSMVLLAVLRELSERHGWQLAVAHLNHRLRGRSSEADERLVRAFAEKLGVPAIIERAEVRQFARARKLSLEMAAREVRHDFLARAAAQRQIPTVALAHHADDQLEHFFLRLLRGSGGEGMAGMKWWSRSPSDPAIELVRPLLDLPKAALRAYAAGRKIRFREDASNAWLDIQRNRIRHELLPLLRQYQPALDKTVPRVMDIVGAEAEFVTEAARDWLQQKHPVPSFKELPVAVQRRCVQLQLLKQGVAPDYDLVEQLRIKAARPVSIGGAGQLPEMDDTGRTTVQLFANRDESGVVRLQPAGTVEFRDGLMEAALEGEAGEIAFEGARIGWRISGKKATFPPKSRPGREIFDADAVGRRIVLRHWRPGDRFQPIGMPRAVKLQDLFTSQKVPRNRRHELIVAATERGELFWVEGLRIAERFKLTKKTNRCLHWTWQRL